MIEVSGVSKTYGDVTALDAVDLRVASGEVLSLVGANGAGKSTLLSLIAGLRRPDRGTVTLGAPPRDPRRPAVRTQLGYAPQELGVYPRITVAANLLVFAELAGLRGRSARTQIDAVAAELAITGLLRRRAGHLSGGERRRVHVAMALVHGPSVVVLDEPTAGVDIEARGGLLRLIGRLADRGAAVIYSTHYFAEAEMLGGRVAVLHRGRMVADAQLATLVEGRPGRIELTFDGRVPELFLGASTMTTSVDGNVLTVTTAEPERNAALVLAAAAPHAERLRCVRVLPASLEDAYLALTGEVLAEQAS